MKLQKLSLSDRSPIQHFLALKVSGLSAYSFQSIFLWRSLYDISWGTCDGHACIFFRDRLGCFLYLPPLGPSVSEAAIAQAFTVMDRFNRNPAVSRIENVSEADIPFYRGLGYECRHAFDEYVCSRSELARLAGDRYKSKRACANYFTKHYSWDYREFSPRDRLCCAALYRRWMCQRRMHHEGPVYRGMLEDGLRSLKVLLANYAKLELSGRVVRIDGDIKGFTFGFALQNNTFCIVFEVTDVSVKGLSQFIFQRFCQELEGYPAINIMDDSGLANLKAVKQSYRPIRMVPSFTVSRKHG